MGTGGPRQGEAVGPTVKCCAQASDSQRLSAHSGEALAGRPGGLRTVGGAGSRAWSRGWWKVPLARAAVSSPEWPPSRFVVVGKQPAVPPGSSKGRLPHPPRAGRQPLRPGRPASCGHTGPFGSWRTRHRVAALDPSGSHQHKGRTPVGPHAAAVGSPGSPPDELGRSVSSACHLSAV